MLVRIRRIGFFRLDGNMVEIHVDSLVGFEQSHLHVEFHQKVIESWGGVESEHIARLNVTVSQFSFFLSDYDMILI